MPAGGAARALSTAPTAASGTSISGWLTEAGLAAIAASGVCRPWNCSACASIAWRLSY
jgi:hypothetical protein